MARVDYDEMAGRYDAGRRMDDWAAAPWRDAVGRWLPPATARLIDLGAGTGAWTRRLVEWFDVDVVAVEPSAGMRTHLAPCERVAVLAAAAEALPLADGACDAAWLSVVVHHLDDLDGAVRELRRVLGPTAPVLIRSAVPGVPSDPTDMELTLDEAGLAGRLLYPALLFPTARDVIATFPSLDRLDEAFTGAGFRRDHAGLVAQGQAASLRELYERLSLRADTSLVHIPDEEFADGLRRLAAMAEAEAEPVRCVSALPFVVYR
jgi:SAM-dependent methyltransferase